MNPGDRCDPFLTRNDCLIELLIVYWLLDCSYSHQYIGIYKRMIRFMKTQNKELVLMHLNNFLKLEQIRTCSDLFFKFSWKLCNSFYSSFIMSEIQKVLIASNFYEFELIFWIRKNIFEVNLFVYMLLKLYA